MRKIGRITIDLVMPDDAPERNVNMVKYVLKGSDIYTYVSRMIADYASRVKELDMVAFAVDLEKSVMTTERAFEIVYELAQENALDSVTCEDELFDEAQDQDEALKVVHDFLVNKVFD